MEEREEGQRAYWRGKDLRDNPYPRDSLLSREWDKGYWDAVEERRRQARTGLDALQHSLHKGLFDPVASHS